MKRVFGMVTPPAKSRPQREKFHSKVAQLDTLLASLDHFTHHSLVLLIVPSVSDAPSSQFSSSQLVRGSPRQHLGFSVCVWGVVGRGWLLLHPQFAQNKTTGCEWCPPGSNPSLFFRCADTGCPPQAKGPRNAPLHHAATSRGPLFSS